MLARGNEGVAARIKVSEGAIGYVEYGFAKRLNLPMAQLENKNGHYVAPNADQIANLASPEPIEHHQVRCRTRNMRIQQPSAIRTH